MKNSGPLYIQRYDVPEKSKRVKFDVPRAEIEKLLAWLGYTSTGAGDYQNMSTGQKVHISPTSMSGCELVQA